MTKTVKVMVTLTTNRDELTVAEIVKDVKDGIDYKWLEGDLGYTDIKVTKVPDTDLPTGAVRFIRSHLNLAEREIIMRGES